MDPVEETPILLDSVEDSVSPVDSGDEAQLTIRIPNPKVYMARQSQWKGRRGKPRCDHCRLNNLKVCPASLTLKSAHSCCSSATECSRRATTVPGPTAANASTRPCPPRRTGAYRAATAVE